MSDADKQTIEVLIYRPGVLMPQLDKITLPKQSPGWRAINDAIAPLIGAGNHVEHVSVLFSPVEGGKSRPHDMFVDEFSALPVHGGKRLPVNDAATLIYHEASRLRGDDMRDAPKIHGVAIVTLKRIWD